MNERWSIQYYNYFHKQWMTHFGAHHNQWEGASWDVPESYTLERCLEYIAKNHDAFAYRVKTGGAHRLIEETSGDTYPIEIFL